MAIHKTEAIILRRYDFRETSLIIDFYTRDFGRVSGLLKGIRTEPSKFASNVDIFSHNEIIFYHKRSSSLHLVSHCDARNNFAKIREDINRVSHASFMMELISALMQPEDKNEEIFDLAMLSLSELGLAGNPEKIAMIFKIKMLALSGFKPHFDSCVSCSGRISGQSKFSLSQGGLLCPGCFAKDMTSRMIFRGTVASILHIERSDFKSSLNLGLNPQIKRELDFILNAFLHFHLERELKSQRVINKLANAIP